MWDCGFIYVYGYQNDIDIISGNEREIENVKPHKNRTKCLIEVNPSWALGNIGHIILAFLAF